MIARNRTFLFRFVAPAFEHRAAEQALQATRSGAIIG
jgi:hypothetical protein